MKGKGVDLDGGVPFHPTCDGEHQEIREIRSGKRDIPSPGMAIESATACQMDASVNISVQASLCQSSSSKTSEQEN
ncbi:hypothetical protein ccbrp13_62300 [Ktedonobacteria bacterium brp13]|nr:hypothetical protein ccbrp13_62300 [Ktedonobacteria bacterium brp13]